MYKRLFCLGLLCLALVSNAYGKDQSITRSGNDFGFELYKKLSASSTNHNIFISPYSVYTALAMAYAGADGVSKIEFEKALNITSPDNFHVALAQSIESLNQRNDKGFSVSIANALWIDKQIKVLDSYQAVTKKYYGATENQIDDNDPGESADKVNNWVAEKTNGKITKLISASDITRLTKLIITNAIYFKGQWQTPFKKEATFDGNFISLNSEVKKIRMMRKQDKFYYAEIDNFKLLELPYAADNKTPGSNLSMILVLPNASDAGSLTSAENALSEDMLQKFESSKSSQEVNVQIPKFKLETPVIDVSEMLQALGLHAAFNPVQPDFTNITGKPELYISQVLHKAMIEVNEEGTEAAAATAVVVMKTAMMHPTSEVKEFTADRPFLYMIRDNQTGLVLFVGKLLQPIN